MQDNERALHMMWRALHMMRRLRKINSSGNQLKLSSIVFEFTCLLVCLTSRPRQLYEHRVCQCKIVCSIDKIDFLLKKCIIQSKCSLMELNFSSWIELFVWRNRCSQCKNYFHWKYQFSKRELKVHGNTTFHRKQFSGGPVNSLKIQHLLLKNHLLYGKYFFNGNVRYR